MGRWVRSLQPAYMDRAFFEIDVVPCQANQFAHPEAGSICQRHHRCVPKAIEIVLERGFFEPLYLPLGKVKTSPQTVVFLPVGHCSLCPIFSAWTACATQRNDSHFQASYARIVPYSRKSGIIEKAGKIKENQCEATGWKSACRVDNNVIARSLIVA